MCQAGAMLAVSSEYKNDLVCTQHAVSLTSFNFTARVGFITLLLSKCASVCVWERKMEWDWMILCIYLSFFNAQQYSSVPHLCAHTKIFCWENYSQELISVIRTQTQWALTTNTNIICKRPLINIPISTEYDPI